MLGQDFGLVFLKTERLNTVRVVDLESIIQTLLSGIRHNTEL